MTLHKIVLDMEVIRNTPVGPEVYMMILQGDNFAGMAEPGQFIHLRIHPDVPLLRRPFGIADTDVHASHLTLFYRVLGKGTRAMTSLRPGDIVNCLGPLGNGFSLESRRPLLVGGGMGLAPLLYLAKEFHGKADVLMGGRSKQELFWENIFAPSAHALFLATDDGSAGKKGFTTELLPEILESGQYDCIYTCGPEIMMRGIAEIAKKYAVRCQVSLEKRMACGLGACLSCVCDTAKDGRKKICKDGPVFDAEDVFF